MSIKKKNGRTRGFVFAVAIVLCLSMAACGSNESESEVSMSEAPGSNAVSSESSKTESSKATDNSPPNKTVTSSVTSGSEDGGADKKVQDVSSIGQVSHDQSASSEGKTASSQPAGTNGNSTDSKPNVTSKPTTAPTHDSTPTPTPETTLEPTPDPTEPPEPSVAAMGSGYLTDVLSGVNSHRSIALSMDGDLSATAQAHAEEMARQKNAYHSCSGTESVGSGAWEDGFTEGSMLTVHCSDLAGDDIVRIGIGAAKDANGSIYVCIVGKTY